jgi:hypothetical protein
MAKTTPFARRSTSPACPLAAACALTALAAFGALYTDNFGVPDTDTVAFFRNVGVPADVPIREPQ